MSQQSDSSGRNPFTEGVQHGACIKVISVGGGGNNAINRMIDLGLDGVEFISVNTDLQSLQTSKAQVRLQVGARLTLGLGTGSNPEVGRRAALDDSDRIVEALEGADMVFITAGLGGGTGTGVAPVVASAASRMGALTVAIVTLPFAFEGKRRMNQAERGLQDLLDHVDTLIVIPNDRLLDSAKDMGFFESFQIADDVLRQAVQGISDIITVPGVINRDFADIRTTMAVMGYGVMGTASRSGPRRASEAALAAIASPLLAAGAIEGARGILINIAGSNSLKLTEVHEAATIIQRAAHEDANIIFGAVLDERLGDEIKITVIAAGFHQESRERAQRRSSTQSDVETPTAIPPKQAQPVLDAAIQDATALHPERGRPESRPLEVAVDDAEDVSAIPVTQLRPPDESKESRQAAEIEPENFAIEEVAPLAAHVDHRSLEPTPTEVAGDPYDEDLLTFLEGLPFDANSPDNLPSPSRETDILLQTETARARQAAMAAYTGMSTRELEDTEPIPDETASFAEILESRRLMHGAEDTEFDQDHGDEEMPHEEQVASSDLIPKTAEGNKTFSSSLAGVSLSHRLTADATIPLPSSSDATPSPSIASVVPASNVSASVIAARTSPLPSQAKIANPDFNRKLNRKPDYSTGLEVV